MILPTAGPRWIYDRTTIIEDGGEMGCTKGILGDVVAKLQNLVQFVDDQLVLRMGWSALKPVG